MADFKVCDTFLIDLGGKQELDRIIAHRLAVAKLDESDPVIEDLEGRFLSFAIEQMPEDKNRLAFAFRAEISEGMLRHSGAGKLTRRACSYRWHQRTMFQKLHGPCRI
jgi:hypothetical protein